MKFIKQLSDNQFIVEMRKEDLDKDIRIRVVHNYVQIDGQDWHCEDYQVKGPYGFANIIHNHASIQIPIRVAQDILKTISDNKYLQESHLVNSHDEPLYLKDNCAYHYCKNGKNMIAIMDSNTGEFTHIPESIYNAIKSS